MRITKTGFLASKMVCSTVPYTPQMHTQTEKDSIVILAIRKERRRSRSEKRSPAGLLPPIVCSIYISFHLPPHLPKENHVRTVCKNEAIQKKRTLYTTAPTPTMIVNWTTHRVALMNSRFSSPSPNAIDSAPISPEQKATTRCQQSYTSALLLTFK